MHHHDAGLNRLVFGIFAALAEFERTRTGLASAHLYNSGRPFKMTAAKLRLAQAAIGQPGSKVGELRVELSVSRQTLHCHVDPKGTLRLDGEKLLDGGMVRVLRQTATPTPMPVQP